MRVFALLSVAVGLLAAAPAIAENDAPAGWLLADTGPAAAQKPVIADFDGDGRPDRAELLVDTTGHKFGLFVQRASTGSYEPLGPAGDIARLADYSFRHEPPQTLVDVCHRGAGKKGAPCRPAVKSRWTGIGSTWAEASHRVFFWDGARFDSVWLSD